MEYDLPEAKMNDFPDGNNDIAKQFAKDPYRFLIAANKFQTGFDQPLLHTMYVDKELSDVQAVQTLSRLNRAYKPDKTDTFVLDFFNEVDDIQEAFAGYYTTTILSGETDVNKLNDLQDDLNKMQIYDSEDIEEAFKAYYSQAGLEAFTAIIDSIADLFDSELEQEEQIKFKSNAKAFVRTYAYLSKIINFNNKYWEKLWLFLKHLIPKLQIENDEPDENILDAIDMESYRINKTGDTNISIDENENIIDPIPVSTTSGKPEEQYDTLTNIINEFNRKYANMDEDAMHILTVELPNKMKQDTAILESIENSDKENAKITSDAKIADLMQTFMMTHTNIYKKFVDDLDFKKDYQTFVFDMMLHHLNKTPNTELRHNIV